MMMSVHKKALIDAVRYVFISLGQHDYEKNVTEAANKIEAEIEKYMSSCGVVMVEKSSIEKLLEHADSQDVPNSIFQEFRNYVE